MKLEEKLVALRKAHGLSQLKLAEKINVSRQAVSRWEVGSAVPSTENLILLSELYGVSIDYLINGEPTQSENISKENSKIRRETEKSAENKGHKSTDCRKTRNTLSIIFGAIAIALIVFGGLTHSIAISLAAVGAIGIIVIIHLFTWWLIHIIMHVKTSESGDKEK